MRPSALFLGVLGIAFGWLLVHPRGFADALPDSSFVPGDKITGAIDYAGDADEATFPALKGMRVKTWLASATPALTPVLGVRDAADQPVKMSKAAGKLKTQSFSLAANGEYRLRIAGSAGATGAYEVLSSCTLPATAKKKSKRVVAGAETLAGSATIDMLPGTKLDLLVTPAKGVPIVTLWIVRPDLSEVDLTAFVTTDAQGRMTVSAYDVGDQVGTYAVKVTGFLTKGQSVTVKMNPVPPSEAKTLALVESVLDPGAPPANLEMTYQLAPTLTVGAAALPVNVATPLDSGEVGSGVALDGLRPTLSQVCWLVTASGDPYAPFLVRPTDITDPPTPLTIDAHRVAMGILAIHPWLTRLTETDREKFFDLAPSAASFEFVATAAREALASDPLSIYDPSKFPEIFKASTKAVEETLAMMPWLVTLKSASPSDSLTVVGGQNGAVTVVNPRWVFYGVHTDGPRGQQGMYVVEPRQADLTAFPPGSAVPGTLTFTVPVGRTDITAEARALPIDLSTAGGMGAAANGFEAVFQYVRLMNPWPVTISTADLARLTTEYIARSGSLPNRDLVLADLNDILGARTTEELLQRLNTIVDDHWQLIAQWVWQAWPAGQSTRCYRGGVRYLQGYAAVGAFNDAAPFLYDLVRSTGEGPLTFTVIRTGNDVELSGEPPFTYAADFTWSPVTPVVTDTVTFDPSASVFNGTPPFAPTYDWSFYDDPLLPPATLSMGNSSAAVQHAFATPGFHLVVLEVKVGNATQRAFHTVWVDSFTNLGFETGTMDGWTVETHTWQDPTPGSQPSHSAIMGIGMDPIATQLPTVFSGLYSLRIEDSGSYYYISSASRTITIPQAGSVLKFAWAAVLEDPQHDPANQPYFDIKVVDLTTGSTLYAIHHYSNEPGFPWQNADYWGSWKYVPWQPVTLDLSAYGGHQVTITAIGADCGYGGHGGYVYLDAP